MILPINRSGLPLRPLQRGLVAGWGLVLSAVFALSASLEPDPRGYGTHEGLGLPPCTVRVLAGIPCPSCGMTTSFANFVRGDLGRAARANVSGLLLATVCAASIPWALASSFQGRLIGMHSPEQVVYTLIIAGTAIALTEWAVRLILFD